MHFILLLLGFEHFRSINRGLYFVFVSSRKQLIFTERLVNCISIKSDFIPYFVRVTSFLGNTVESFPFQVRSELLRKFEVWQTRREVSSSTGGGLRTTYPYIVSSEKNTTFNRTTTLSAQVTPDFNQVPLTDIKDAKSSGKVEKKYSFDNINVTPRKDSELSVPEDDADREEVEDSGRSTPVELGKEVGNNDVGGDSVGHV